MKKTFDKEYYLSHRGCYDREKMSALIEGNAHATIDDFLSWPISVKDKLYFVRRYCDLTARQLQELALMCAKVSLKIYEAKYPNDASIRECIDATGAFLDGRIGVEELRNKRNAAADAADAAAYAAAADAAAADIHTQNLLNSLKQFCKDQN